MSNIKIMSQNLANKIAAGEVVESCASVVKELVENSIDASSDEIIISLKNGGLNEIKVVDNGIGMDESDALLAFERHATSKLLKEDDLFFIDTLGFRGEALPSIASVSIITLKTCQKDLGIEIEIHGGKVINNTKCEARIGTSISVKDLFYNTPARLKYLKGPKEELTLVTNYIERLALSKPNIKFTLLNDERKVLQTTGSGDLLKTIYEIYGYGISSNMLDINGSNDDCDVYGYICKPSVLKSNRNHMITIVNGRIVKNNDLNRCINDAYYTHKPDSKYPVVVININIDPTLIDVNIHPTKQDIKISKMFELKVLLDELIKNALNGTNLIPKINIASTPVTYEEIIPKTIKVEEEQINFTFNDSRRTEIIPDEIKENITPIKEVIEESVVEKEEVKPIYPVGLLLGTYIACQNEDGIYLIDQHAAQERINYEKNMRALRAKEISTTSMLVPITIELSKSEYQTITNHLDVLTKMGFLVEEFGINTLIFKEHPTWLKEGYEEESIRKILDLMMDIKGDFDPIKFNEHIAITLACKLSIKANHEISHEAEEQLINDLFKCDNPYNCPHGRPTIITFTNYELEKMFKRVMN